MFGSWSVSYVANRLSRVTRVAVALGSIMLAVSLVAAPGPNGLVSGMFAADAAAQTPATGQPTLVAEMWTPRTETGRIHLHGGLFAPIDAQATCPTLGARVGLNLGSHLLLGVLADWSFKSKSVDSSSSSLPGFEPKILLAKVDAHLIPAMVFLELRITDKFPVVPYGGVGAGYEWLVLRANDYRTNESRSVTYANWAWQGYAGVGLSLSDKLRVDGELFYNGGFLERDVQDPSGRAMREVVDAEGVGARFGLDIVY